MSSNLLIGVLILVDSPWIDQTFFWIPFHIIVVIFSVTVAMVTTVVTRISLKSLGVPDPSLGLVSNSLAAPPELVSLLISLTPHLKHSIMISEQMPWTAIKYGSLLVHQSTPQSQLEDFEGEYLDWSLAHT